MPEKSRFAHRLTDAQTYDSICLQCYRTVGNADFESGLERAEDSHVCLPEDMLWLRRKMEPETVSSARHKKESA